MENTKLICIKSDNFKTGPCLIFLSYYNSGTSFKGHNTFNLSIELCGPYRTMETSYTTHSLASEI